MMRIFGLLMFVMSLSTNVMAADCRYQTRPNDMFFQNLPKEIKGWVNCGAENGNILYVAKSENKTLPQWEEWIRNYQEVLNPEPAKLKLLKSGKLAGGIQTHWIETQRSTGSTRHLLIIKPNGSKNSLVFVQSANIGTGEKAAFSVPESLRRIVRGVDPMLLDREFPITDIY